MYTIVKNIAYHARLKKKSIYFAMELSLREISFVVYVNALICVH